MKLSAKITTVALSAVFMASAALPAFGASCGNSPWGGNQGHSGGNHDKNYSRDHRDHDRNRNCGDNSNYRHNRCNHSNCWRCQEAKRDLLRTLASNASQHEKREAWQKYSRIAKFLDCEKCNNGCNR